MNRPLRTLVFCAAVVCAALAPYAQAQSALTITAISSEKTGVLRTSEGKEALLTPTDPDIRDITEGQVSVIENEQVMLLDRQTQTVVILLGPAKLDIHETDLFLNLDLVSGRMLVRSSGEDAEEGLYLSMRPEPDATPFIEAAPGEGETYLSRVGDQLDFAFATADGAPRLLAIKVNGVDEELAAGQRWSYRDGEAQIVTVAPWLAESGLADPRLAERIGVRYARLARRPVVQSLYDTVISWDREAAAESVVQTLRSEKFKPEIRTVAVTVTAAPTSSNQGTAAGADTAIPGANQVPPLSPAAIAVGGQSVLLNNTLADRLLTITRSRGLGFNGPSRLAVPGFTGGVRTPGPPGLGAQP